MEGLLALTLRDVVIDVLEPPANRATQDIPIFVGIRLVMFHQTHQSSGIVLISVSVRIKSLFFWRINLNTFSLTTR